MLSIVEKALLVQLYYKNSESAIVSISLHEKSVRDSKRLITSSALNKIMKQFEATGSLGLRQRGGRPSITAVVTTTMEQTVQSISVVFAHGECSAQEVSRQTGVSYGSVRRHTFVEVPLQQPKVTVWYGFTAEFIIGPFFSRKSNRRVSKQFLSLVCDM
ncbi:transposable element tc3 transposase [Trichonephila clavata]|uniref:Transposable element tc3 transposase n=1 Tax=Trichonephila clavata TaxID=2740835 RepID=A0A8X6HDI8_TRICU|nr:transposable element tc3 transposase [Trichonephila clavata]